MPARVSARASRTSTTGAGQGTVSRKNSAANMRSTRTSADHRVSSSPCADIPDEGEVTVLRKHVGALFSDAQKTTLGHRKLANNLRKIQEACCYEPQSKRDQQHDDFDEEDFRAEFLRCALRILVVRKSEPAADRVLAFMSTFFRQASDKDNAIFADQDGEFPETPTSRLSNALVSVLLPLFTAKDKTVRFRALQICSRLIYTLDTVDDALFHALRLGFLKRLHDREASVRIHAVYGLTRLAADAGDASADGQSSDSDSEQTSSSVQHKLLHLLQHDPSAEVRRCLLLNLELSPQTLPFLLERARDHDAPTRRALFSRLLPALGDFRHLSLTHREKLLRWGLRDRDEGVRKAAGKLFRERWIEDCAKLPGSGDMEAKKEGGEVLAAEPSMDALQELLERVDVANSAAKGVAAEAMDEFWTGRPDYVSHVHFGDAFWQELTPESIFVVRTFNDWCRKSEDRDVRELGRLMETLEGKMPEVTKFGFLLEREIKALVDAVKRAAAGGPDGEGDEEAEEESVSREFVVEQMLSIAGTFDYSDEVGRRKMFGLLRDATAMPELPEEATRLAVEVLRLVCGDDGQGKGEREFCAVVIEAIAEVHDTIMGDDDEKEKSEDGDESFHSARSDVTSESGKVKKQAQRDADGDTSMDDGEDEEKAIRVIMVNIKCLHIAQCMLQNVQCDLEANTDLLTMLNTLVVPAVRSQEAPIRERGLICMGLCCLLGKNLAQENLTLFFHCFAKGHAELQCIALQIITDILTTHPALLAPSSTQTEADATEIQEPSPFLKPTLRAFSKALKSESQDVQSTGATALSKVMLSQLITDTDILKQLVVTFFDPETSSNAQLRQALSYFLPVYCHSRYDNAVRMVRVAPGIINRIGGLRDAFVEEIEDDGAQAEMVTTGFVGGLLVDWTDPRKIVGGKEQAFMTTGRQGQDEDEKISTHLLLAETLLERMVTGQTNKDERKVLFSMLGKLHLSGAGLVMDGIKTVLELIAEATEGKLAVDVTSRNVLTKLQTTLLKAIHDVAGAERGLEGTEWDVTGVPTTPARRRTQVVKVEDVEDEVSMQLQRELEATRIEDAVGAEQEDSKLSVIGEGKEEESVVEGLDVSQLPDEKEMQSLMDSLDDDEDDDL